MRARVLVAAAACAVLALAAAALLVGLQRGGTAAEVVSTGQVTVELGAWKGPVDACLDPARTDPVRSSECLLNLAKDSTGRGEFGAALAVLREGDTRSQDMVARCHNAAHEVGRAMVAAGMALEAVYTVPFADCRFGLYHGGLQEHVVGMGIDELTAAMPTLCTYFGPATENATQECVHVTGHFVVDLIGTDLRRSLDTCAVYAEDNLRSRCSDGVFMQAIDLSRPGVGRPEDPAAQRIAATWGTGHDEQGAFMARLCAEQQIEEVAYVCYTAVSQTLAVLWSGDYRAVGEVCAELPADGIRPCFEGVAASAFTLMDWDAQKIADACHAHTAPGTEFCMRSYAFTMGLQNSAERAGAACDLALPREMATCREGLADGQRIAGEMASNVDRGGPGATDPQSVLPAPTGADPGASA